MACSAHRDQHGTSYLIPPAAPAKTPGYAPKALRGYPAVDVWWSRNFKRGVDEETLIIRQEYEERPTADVVELTLGQVYDLIEALNKAVENT